MTAMTRASSTPGLTRSGAVRLISVLATLVVTAAIFFAAAGTLALTSAWIYYCGLLGYLLVSLVALALFIPQASETINARGRTGANVKSWDRVFGIAYTALLLISPAVAGFDAGRLRSFDPPPAVSWAAVAVTVLAYAFVHWAMVVNRHAETGVRIQDDRGHEVISSGPYRFVRHPFYSALIVTQLVYPLAVGSLYAFVPAAVTVVLFVWRTRREDATLRRELAGYEAFTQRTRYRLLPGVW